MKDKILEILEKYVDEHANSDLSTPSVMAEIAEEIINIDEIKDGFVYCDTCSKTIFKDNLVTKKLGGTTKLKCPKCYRVLITIETMCVTSKT